METLVIMAKYPQPGLVKTRLAAEVGDQRACDLYAAFLRDIHATMSNQPWSTLWAMAPPGARLADQLHPEPSRYIDQTGNSLGERMYNAFLAAFDAGSDRIVMVGGDTPQLSRAEIAQSFDLLEQHDVVIIPSRDGGYCAIGMRTARDLFSSIEMSTPRVLDGTRHLCRRLNLSARELPMRYDIDELSDVRRLATDLATEPGLEATRDVLEDWRTFGLL